MMSPQAVLVIVVMWLASVIGAFFYGSNTGEDRAVAKQAAVDKAAEETRKANNLGAANAIAKSKVRTVYIQGKVQTIIKDNPVYVACNHDADSMQLVNEALTGRPGPAGDSSVP